MGNHNKVPGRTAQADGFLPDSNVRPARLLIALLLGASLAGCTVAPSPGEERARAQVSHVGSSLDRSALEPSLPDLRPDSALADCVRFAVLNHPRVEAAYHDWRGSVSAIAPARALPDPRLTFEADITDTLMTLMPGLMFDFMTPGKRAAMAGEMTAASNVAHRVFVSAVLDVAAEVQRAWIELAYTAEARVLYLAAIDNLGQSLALAESEYSTGRMMASLETQVRLQSQIAEHHAHHFSVDDRLAAARARFKAALGLSHSDRDPPWPAATLAATPLPTEDELWHRTLAANPGLAQMRAMVEMAIAGVEVARKSGTPDFALGLMTDLKASPLMFRPAASVSLPVWREKIASTIAAAEARRDAAAARVTAEQLNLAAELAQMLFMVRESDRMLAYIDTTALPNLERLGSVAEAGYQSGASGAAMITDAAHMALLMRLERIEILRQRENAATGLMLMSAAV
ncbi:MAG TPA: TolC family protein, partial [Opitutaceae bacterium]